MRPWHSEPRARPTPSPHDRGTYTIQVDHQPLHIEVAELAQGRIAARTQQTGAAAIGAPAYAIDEQTAIKVVAGSVEVVSEGLEVRFPWRLTMPIFSAKSARGPSVESAASKGQVVCAGGHRPAEAARTLDFAGSGDVRALWHNATTSYPLCLSVKVRP